MVQGCLKRSLHFCVDVSSDSISLSRMSQAKQAYTRGCLKRFEKLVGMSQAKQAYTRGCLKRNKHIRRMSLANEQMFKDVSSETSHYFKDASRMSRCFKTASRMSSETSNH
eukprot:7900647-Pyramimonas_sp.AAC.1